MKEDYQVERFHERIAENLEDVAHGRTKYLVIEMPPRWGKSKLVSVNFPTFVLGHNPYVKFVVAWYWQELVNEFSREAKAMVMSEKYKAIFWLDMKVLSGEAKQSDSELPNEVKLDTERVTHWITYREWDQERAPDKKGYYHAVWVGWWLTGYWFDIGIIDDPVKNREEAESPVIREKVWDWYKSVFNTRQMNEDSATIIVMTRRHSDDLRGRIEAVTNEMKKKGLDVDFDDWKIVSVPALTPAPRKEWTGTEASKWKSFRPSKFGVPYLLRKRAEIGVRDFEALYQQDPIASMGNIFKPQDYRYAKLSDFDDSWGKEPKYRKDHIEMWLCIDPAFSTGKTSDDAALAVVGRHKITNDRFLFDLYADTSAPSITIDYAFMMMDKRRNRGFEFEWRSCEYVTINKDQTHFYDEIRNQMSLRNDFVHLYKWKPAGKKDDRIKFSLEPIIANHKLFFLEDQIPLDLMGKFLKQLQEFPDTDKKDIIDVVAQSQILFRERWVKKDDKEKKMRERFDPIAGKKKLYGWDRHQKF